LHLVFGRKLVLASFAIILKFIINEL